MLQIQRMQLYIMLQPNNPINLKIKITYSMRCTNRRKDVSLCVLSTMTGFGGGVNFGGPSEATACLNVDVDTSPKNNISYL